MHARLNGVKLRPLQMGKMWGRKARGGAKGVEWVSIASSWKIINLDDQTKVHS